MLAEARPVGAQSNRRRDEGEQGCPRQLFFFAAKTFVRLKFVP